MTCLSRLLCDCEHPIGDWSFLFTWQFFRRRPCLPPLRGFCLGLLTKVWKTKDSSRGIMVSASRFLTAGTEDSRYVCLKTCRFCKLPVLPFFRESIVLVDLTSFSPKPLLDWTSYRYRPIKSLLNIPESGVPMWYSALLTTTAFSGSNFAKVSWVTHSSSPVGITITISEQYSTTENQVI